MDNFTKPSISQTIRLPGYEHSDQMAWPVVPPNDLAASYAALMRPSRDIRYTADWRQAAEADRLERLQIAECRAAEAEAAKVTSRTEYERTLIKNNRRNVNAAPTNGGVGSKQSSGAFLHAG